MKMSYNQLKKIAGADWEPILLTEEEEEKIKSLCKELELIPEGSQQGIKAEGKILAVPVFLVTEPSTGTTIGIKVTDTINDIKEKVKKIHDEFKVGGNNEEII